MELIDKAAVVADIDELQNTTMDENKNFLSSYHEGIFDGLSMVEHFINTLEVKEVDLDKKIKDYFDNQPTITRSKGVDYQLIPSGENIAKHFFELGLRSTITEEDCKLIWTIGDELPYMPEEDFFKELLKRYKTYKEK